jgi:hypothetical protein
MEWFLHGDHPILATLREQLAVASIANREFTGVGFFTNFQVPNTARRLSNLQRLVIGDLHSEVAGSEHGVGFLLFVDDGRLHFLEGFAYDAPWPGDLKLIRLCYLRPQEPGSGAMIETAQRDLSFLDAHE